MKSSQRTRGRKYPRRAVWTVARNKIFERAGGICEVSGEDLFSIKHGEDCTDSQCDSFDEGNCKLTWRRAVHHIVAERFCRLWFKGSNPHCEDNLVCVTSALHARLTQAERKLHRADIVGYRQALNGLGFPPELFDRALKALNESVKK